MGIIKPKELNKLGYTDNVARSLAIELVAKHCKHHTQEEVFNILRDVHLHPERYKNDEVWVGLQKCCPLQKLFRPITI